MSSLLPSAVALILTFIAGSVMYQMYEATKFILVISLIGTFVFVGLAIAAHKSRKSYIRFTWIEHLFIFLGTFLMLSIAQSVAILALN